MTSPSQPARESGEILSATQIRKMRDHSWFRHGGGKKALDSHEALRAALARAEARLALTNGEANLLTNTLDAVRAQRDRLRDALERIANEPPDRGLTPDFRQFARAALAPPSREDTGTETAE